MIYLLRHAHAGNKQAWSGPDGRRPLSATGRREAAGLLVQLRARPVDAILSSPALRRCGPPAEARTASYHGRGHRRRPPGGQP